MNIEIGVELVILEPNAETWFRVLHCAESVRIKRPQNDKLFQKKMSDIWDLHINTTRSETNHLVRRPLYCSSGGFRLAPCLCWWQASVGMVREDAYHAAGGLKYCCGFTKVLFYTGISGKWIQCVNTLLWASRAN